MPRPAVSSRILLLAALLLLAAPATAQRSLADADLGFWNGPDWVPLDPDPASLGVRFEAGTDEVTARRILARVAVLPAGESVETAYFPGHTVQLQTAAGTTLAQAFEAARALRDEEGVVSASLRLWAYGDPYYLTEEILVRWLPGTEASVQAALTEGLEPTGWIEYSENPGRVYRVPTHRDPLAEANRLAESGWVRFAVPDFQLKRRLHGGGGDPLLYLQWHLEADGQNGPVVDADIDATEAWGIENGSSAVNIALIDTGLQLDHPDLVENLYETVNATDLLLDDVLDEDDDPSAEDFFGGLLQESHATAMAGIIGAKAGNGIGVSGVMQNCALIPIRLMSEEGGPQPTLADEAQAFSQARVFGAHMAACGWGPEIPAVLPVTTKDAIDDYTTNARGGLGGVVLFAAGNDGGDVADNGYAAYERVIAVGAVTDSGVRASYSNKGQELDVVGPSNGGLGGIVTTDRTGADGYGAQSYIDTFGGTCAAVGSAAGVLGLAYSIEPNLTHDNAHLILTSTCERVGGVRYGSDSHHNKYGHGRVNAEEIIYWAANFGDPTDTIVLTGPATINAGEQLPLSWTNAPPNSEFTLLATRQNMGGYFRGQSVDVGPKYKMNATGMNDALGNGSILSSPIPTRFIGWTVNLEVVAQIGLEVEDSNMITMDIL